MNNQAAHATSLLFPQHTRIAEPILSFHPDRPEDCGPHPLEGLLKFGPYSRALINSVLDPIRVAAVVPASEKGKVSSLLAEMERRHQPRERPQYLPEYPGFSRVFGLRLVPADGCEIELPSSLDSEIAASEQPHILLADRLKRAIDSLNTRRSEFDVLVLLLPKKWESGFWGGDEEDFDLHDFLKAASASLGIPLQVIREDKALSYPCRCSVSWRLGIALYCKAGGVPWKLANTDPETAYVGLSYAVKSDGLTKPAFVVCCSQVFDSDGAGLQFLAYETEDVKIEHDNPFLSRSEMRRLMARSLALYQKRHAGRVPKHLVVHKSTEFKPDEVEGCFDAWRAVPTLELIQVQEETPWRGMRIDPPQKKDQKRGEPAAYPCERGTFLPLSDREILLWTQGIVPEATKKTYFQGGKGIPTPLLLRRFAGHGGWDESVQRVLGLTKMDWNNDALYNRLPVTLEYSSVLARIVKRMPSLSPRPYECRFFM